MIYQCSDALLLGWIATITNRIDQKIEMICWKNIIGKVSHTNFNVIQFCIVTHRLKYARAFNMFSYLLCSDMLLLAIHPFCANPHAMVFWLQLRLQFSLILYEIHLQWSEWFVFLLQWYWVFQAVGLFLGCKRVSDREKNVHTMYTFHFHSHTHCVVNLFLYQLIQFGEIRVDVSVLYSKFHLGHTHIHSFSYAQKISDVFYYCFHFIRSFTPAAFVCGVLSHTMRSTDRWRDVDNQIWISCVREMWTNCCRTHKANL